jgi:hypothetical protein
MGVAVSMKEPYEPRTISPEILETLRRLFPHPDELSEEEKRRALRLILEMEEERRGSDKNDVR